MVFNESKVFSAGLEPGNLNPVVIEAMKQDGIETWVTDRFKSI